MERKYIPKYMNAEMQILWWDLSEFLILLVIIVFGVIAEMQFIATAIGVGVLKVITKMKNHKQAGFVGHYAYSKGLFGLKGRVPEFWIKEIVK
ncbi:type IV conjugative transfer system protein TraL [Aliarcobacter butzleri]|uniref:type IV conjugative transfer system protein TraL n=1 Tax=Aliarcobacter butzleri TaxID=28197 RepID=UPI00125F8463|nr:type IV conjugative transfer system protein TraL [Aliarcobacter butzleri]